jgi:hypothetical protein
MSAVVNKVLSMDPEVRAGTDSYIDDIIVNEEIVSCERVEELLRSFGLEPKPPKPLIGGRVLGLWIFEKDGTVMWKRGNIVEQLKPSMTKREVFSLCGQLVGHFPVARWLRPACSIIKRSFCEQTSWDKPASSTTMEMLKDTLEEVSVNDPVRGVWMVSSATDGRI